MNKFVLIILLVCAQLGSASLAKAGPNEASYRASNPPATRTLNASETRLKLGHILGDSRYRALRDYLGGKGFSPSIDDAASSETISQGGLDDGYIVFIPFRPKDFRSQAQGGQAWSGDAKTAILHVGSRNGTEEWGATILQKVGDEVDAAEKVVVNQQGQIVPANSWWSCFRYNVLVFCGGGALGCFSFWWWGPQAIIACVVGLCGPTIASAAIYCIGR